MAYFLILAAATLRLIPHIPNFAPIGAMALFGGTYLNKKSSIIIPLAAMVASDFFLGFDSVASRASVYSSFILIGLVGIWLKKRKTLANVIGATLLSSVLFYLVTNLVFFYPPVMYPHTAAGQLASYVNALPFFRGTLLGDLFYVAILFGVYEFITARAKAKATAWQTVRH